MGGSEEAAVEIVDFPCFGKKITSNVCVKAAG